MFQNNAIAKVWKITDSGDLQISTSYKLADGNYQTDFSGYVKNRSEIIPKVGETIKMLKTGVKQLFNKESGKTSTIFYIFELEICDFSNYTKGKPKKEKSEELKNNTPEEKPQATNESLLDIMNRDELPF